MTPFLRVYRQAFALGAADFKSQYTWKSWSFGWLTRILTNAAIWVMVGNLLHSPGKVRFLLIGNAAVAGLGTGVAASAITWDISAGTFPLLLVAPSSLAPGILGRTSVTVLNWAVTSLLAFAVLSLAFGLALPFPAWLLLPLLILPSCFSTYGFSILVGVLIMHHPPLRVIAANLVSIMLIAFCGVSVPLDFWPGWAQPFLAILPASHGVAAIRLLLDGGDAGAILHNVGLELADALGWFLLSFLTLDRFAEAGRVEGTIEFS